MKNKFKKISIFTMLLFISTGIYGNEISQNKGEVKSMKNQVPKKLSDTLSTKQKSIIPIAAHTATGDIQKLEFALNKGLDSGLTINEIKEIFVHSYAYAGFPRALNGINTFMSVLDKRTKQGIKDVVGREATAVPANFDSNSYGHKTRNYLVGRDMSNPTGGYQVFVPTIDKFLVEHLFGDIFYRDTLNYQEHQLVTISILSAMKGTEPQLRSHLGVSMNVGLSKEQLEEFVEVLKVEVSKESAYRALENLNNLLGIKSPLKQNEDIEVIKNKGNVKASKNNFTGDVTVESMFATDSSSNYQGGTVNFEAGARTAWHTHPLGQTLIVISGHGLVQAEGKAIQEISVGDVVWIPANTKHWHGASLDSPMSHVAISSPENNSTVTWGEQVSDKQYNAK